MGKTIGSVLKIGALVGLAIVSGGIAASFGLAAATGATVGATTAAIAGAVSAIATSLAISEGLALGASVLGLGPKSQKPDTTVGAIKQSRPPRVAAYGRSKLFGAYILFDTANSGQAIDVYAFHEGRADAVERYYLSDQFVGTSAGTVSGLADGSYSEGAVYIGIRLGLDTETAFSEVTSYVGPSVWDLNHRGDGVVTGCVIWGPVKAKKYQKVYPNGQPPLAVVGRWQRVFDWRDGTQAANNPATWKWSENAILAIAHFKLYREKALRIPGAIHPSGPALQAAWNRYFAPTVDYWTAAANDADVAMPLKAGGTEPRYRTCLAHKLNDPFKDVTTGLLACCDGWMSPRADQALVIYSGRYYAPTVEIGPDEIVSYTLRSGTEDENAVNELVIDYVSAPHEYGIVQTTPWVDEDNILERGQIRTESLDAQIPSHAQGGRLAKRAMSRVMAPKRGSCTTNSGGRDVLGQRYIWLRIVEADAVLFDAPVEVTAVTRNTTTAGVSFNWVVADPNIDAWNPATEEGTPAAVGDSVALEPLDTPSIEEATPIFDDPISPTSVQIEIEAIGPDRPDLTWYARTRVVGNVSWNEQEYTDADPGASVMLTTSIVPLYSMIEVEVAYQVGDGRVSDYSSPATVVDTTP